ncbi:YdcF family protein [Plebeiibacterium marinum]|uniref:YdcF family protein n=1 Tax=Plebeiibacterium marinum TaxID=2992111 RepID=A0AAE3MAQ7_9BACT|nr:YdcF family protein [Plebeiobacterium marinum]MCW3804184.1 YdcF family protein [Plebeiobacterium marinum]
MIFSNQLLFYYVSGWWEGELERTEKVDHYDGIILLGGFSNYRSQSDRIQFTQSTDRMNQALSLYKQGKADWFVFSGGSARIIVKERMEGEFLKGYLHLMGIPNDSLLVEWQSRNTHENAVETKKMLCAHGIENGKFLLVTSGFHMKRALGCFKKEGINVDSFKTDALQSYLPPDFADAITPSAGTLAMWERLFREWVGYVVYKMKGFVL